jgi:hypothetical protein
LFIVKDDDANIGMLEKIIENIEIMLIGLKIASLDENFAEKNFFSNKRP